MCGAHVSYTQISSRSAFLFRITAHEEIMSKTNRTQAKSSTRKPEPPKAQATRRRVPNARMSVAGADDNIDEAPKSRRKPARKKPAVATNKKKSVAKDAAKVSAKAPAKASAKAPAKRPAKAPAKTVVAPPATPPEAKQRMAVPATERRSRVRETGPAAPARARKPQPPVDGEATPIVANLAGEAPPVGEQQQVESFKYGVVARSARRFEEERFLFPRNYEVDRIRIVVRDPQWLFAYWDVNPRAFDRIRAELGERAMALSRLTLKIVDPQSSSSEVILLPYGARSWYVRVDATRRSAVAELGITLPSGQFRSLARSNAVHIPRSGPSTQPAMRTMSYREAWLEPDLLSAGILADQELEPSRDPGSLIRSGRPSGGASDRLAAEREQGSTQSPFPRSLGASDAFRR